MGVLVFGGMLVAVESDTISSTAAAFVASVSPDGEEASAADASADASASVSIS
jgi:hypothetical protein